VSVQKQNTVPLRDERFNVEVRDSEDVVSLF